MDKSKEKTSGIPSSTSNPPSPNVNKSVNTLIRAVNEFITTEKSFSACFQSMDKLLKNPQHRQKIQKIAIEHGGIDEIAFTEFAKHIETLAKTSPFCENFPEIDLNDPDALNKVKRFLEHQQNCYLKVGSTEGKNTIERHVSMTYLTLFFKIFTAFNAAVDKDKSLGIVALLNHNKQNWSAILINPAQRLPRYNLLLKECVKRATEAPEENNLSTAQSNTIKNIVQLAQENLTFYSMFTDDIDSRIALSSARKPFQTQIDMIIKTIAEQEKKLPATAQGKIDLPKVSETLKKFADELDKLRAEQLNEIDSAEISSLLTTLQTKLAQLHELSTDQIEQAKQLVDFCFKQLTFKIKEISGHPLPKNIHDINTTFFKEQNALIQLLINKLPAQFAGASPNKKTLYYENLRAAFNEISTDCLNNPNLNAFQSTTQYINSVYDQLSPPIVNDLKKASVPINVLNINQSQVNTADPEKTMFGVILDKDEQNLAYEYFVEGHHTDILVMNEMDPEKVGGNWTNSQDSTGSEASLCYTTNLYKHLHTFTHDQDATEHSFSLYRRPIEKTSLTQPTEREQSINAIYSSGVVCFRKANNIQEAQQHIYHGCDIFTFNVFSIAGYDLRLHPNGNPERKLFAADTATLTEVNWPLFEKRVEELYQLVFETALATGNQVVFIKALGCHDLAYQGSDNPVYPKANSTTSAHVAKAFVNTAKKYNGKFTAICVVENDAVIANEFMKAMNNENLDYSVSISSATTTRTSTAIRTSTTTTTTSNTSTSSITMYATPPTNNVSTSQPLQPISNLFNNISSLFNPNKPNDEQEKKSNASPSTSTPTSSPVVHTKTAKTTSTGLGKLSQITSNKSWTCTTTEDLLTTQLSRAIFFTLNPETNIEKSRPTATAQLCIDKKGSASYVANLTYSGLSITLPTPNILNQLAEECLLSNVSCEASTHEPGKFILQISRADLSAFFGFYATNPKQCLDIMHNQIIKEDAATIDQAMALWTMMKPHHHTLPFPVQDFYISNIIKLQSNKFIDSKKFDAEVGELSKRFSSLDQSILMNFEKFSDACSDAQAAQLIASTMSSNF